MTKTIYIFLKNEDLQKQPIIKEFRNNRFHIVIIIVNPRQDISSFLCGKRAETVYCDASFTADKVGQDYMMENIKPVANIRNKEFYLI